MVKKTIFSLFTLFLGIAFQLNAKIQLTGDESLVRTYSVFDEIQEAIGGQILSLFHRPVIVQTRTKEKQSAWIAPVGNWLREGNIGNQIGFVSLTKGMAAGYDYLLGSFWNLGAGFVGTRSDLTLHLGKGSGYQERYAAIGYSDFRTKRGYLGLSFYGAGTKDHLKLYNQFTRNQSLLPRRKFPTAEFTSRASFHGKELGLQFQGAYFFGVPACLFYPYGVVDLFGAKNDSFSSQGSFRKELGSIAFQIESHTTAALRSEAGVALKIEDLNFAETASISPTFALGWAMECPLYRPSYEWTIDDVSEKFSSQGWNQTWQLFTFDFGLNITYRFITVSGSYHSEIAPDGRHDSFWDQWANVEVRAFF